MYALVFVPRPFVPVARVPSSAVLAQFGLRKNEPPHVAGGAHWIRHIAHRCSVDACTEQCRRSLC